MISGAEIMVKCLEAEGVDIVFGYPGAAICPFYDKVYDSSITHILVRQEQNAAHAASGYARCVIVPVFAWATSGPGATNLTQALQPPIRTLFRLVAITGSGSFRPSRRDVFQEADITGACEPFVKHSYLVSKTEDLPRVFQRGFPYCLNRRPVLILIDSR